MRIKDITISESAAGATVAANAVWDKPSLPPERVYFTYRDTPASALAAPSDAFAASMLVPCMAVGEDVVVDEPVSTRLQNGARIVVDIFLSWRRGGPYRTRLIAPAADRSALAPTEVAACFSGGADSFFTILRRPDVTTLMTLVGYDMRHEQRPVFESFLPRLASAAERLGRRMIVVDTNVYEVGRRFLGNGSHHGAVLAGAALGLSGTLRRLYIPGSWSYRMMRPQGSHPFIDPLWSTESLEVVHDGPEYCKIERVLAIAESDVALDTLRVCFRRPELYNCCRCEKCVLVALTLHHAGTLNRCKTLSLPPLPRLRRMLISPDWMPRFAMIRDLLDDGDVKRAVSRAMTVSRLLAPARPVSKVLRRAGLR